MNTAEIKKRLAELNYTGEDSIEKVDLLNDLTEIELFVGDIEATAEKSEDAAAIARRIGYVRGEAYALAFQGFAYWLVTRLEMALATLLEADAAFRTLGDESGIAKVRFVIAAVYRSLGDYDQAYLEGVAPVEYFRSVGDIIYEARARLSLANTSHELGDYDGAMKDQHRVLELTEKSGEEWVGVRALIGLGAAHSAKGEHREALQYFQRSLRSAESSGHRIGQSRALNDLGRSYSLLGNNEKALEYFIRSLEIREQMNHREAQCTTLICLGDLYLDQDSDMSLTYYKKALDVARHADAKPRIHQSHLALSRAFEARGEFKEALEHHRLYQEVQEEVADLSRKRRLKNLQTIFKAEKAEREAEIARLKESLDEGVSLGSYRLKEKLGAGGMGEVWLGEHQLLARPAAVKVIRANGADGPSHDLLVQRFKREAEATASLRSPNTVQLYDFGVSDTGSFHYVMELLHGMDMKEIVDRFGPLQPERLIALMRQACKSLAEAHDHGLIHRDIKPANLFVAQLGGEYDFLKVLDFGMVRATDNREEDDQITTEGSFVGTPAFVAPEFVTGDGSADGRADIYSLGCTAFWALTGRPVFVGNTPTAVLLEHLKTAAPSVAELSEERIPEGLERVIARCLGKNPEERPESAMALWKELGEIECPSRWDQTRAQQWWLRHAPESTDSQ